MELIVGENQYIFQNIKGQKHVLDLPSFMTATRSAGSFLRNKDK
jgi:hypothetical protein